MLKKLITIKNVGKFRNCNAAGEVDFRKLTLIFGENGRGKTTLSAILRSVQTGDPLFISERCTVDGGGSPLIELLTSNGKLSFKGSCWTEKYENVIVFDSTYVAENVYAGDFIEHDHRKRLYHVSIGKQGVDLARKVTDLDAESREWASKIKETSKDLSIRIPATLTLEKFMDLTNDDAVDSKIVSTQKSVEAVSNAEAIKARPILTKFILPEFPSNMSEMLAKSIEGVSKEAEEQVQKHIADHKMGVDGQKWLAEGLLYIQGDNCPFCQQNTIDNDMVAAFRTFFSDGYENLKKEIECLNDNCSAIFSDKKISALKNTLLENQLGVEFWRKYTAVSLPDSAFTSRVEPVIQAVGETIGLLISKKISSPLESILLSPQAERACHDLTELENAVVEYNRAVDSANTFIASVKKDAETGNGAILRRELALLEAKKLRYSDAVLPLCKKLENEWQEKSAVETRKTEIKRELDAFTEEVLQKYENGINSLLDRFGAGFRITGTKQQYLGGSPSSTFKLSVNGIPIDLGDSKTPRGTRCFRSTMSSGDRSTLALAFFIVQLQQRADLNTLVVVFDDPLTSLDRFRQQLTRDQIRGIEKKAQQVIVFSHEPAFLQLIADDYDATNLRLLFLSREGLTDSVIKVWDMKTDLAPGYHKDLATLTAYYHGDAEDLRAVVRCIRPVLEGFLRAAYHGGFPENEWLGEMIGRIRNSQIGDPLESAVALVVDLASLNDYTKRYHHDNNSPKVNAQQIQDGELQPLVKLVLRLTNRLSPADL